MNCPSCDAPAPETARFCMQCGAELATAVRRESLERLIPKQYLDQIAATRGRPAGERRVVTILFCDIKGSTAMAEDLDPEDVMEIMNGAFETLLEPIYRYEGTLARLMGDAILAFFGAPIAHEDDAVRACRAALDILERARAYAAELERDRGIAGFDVRVGINTGLVAVGEVGADLRVEYTAMGDAVNLAARMEAAAEPGTILIAPDTRRLVDGVIETEALGAMPVKGKKEPVEVFRVLGARAGGGARDAADRGVFVGREREAETMRLALAALGAGRGVALAVTGGSGMGKSRLIARTRSVSPPGVLWCEARSASFAGEISYWSAREMLHGMLGTHPSQSPRELAAALDGVLGESSYRDDLLHVLGQAGTGDPRAAAERRRRIVAAFVELAQRRARTSSTVLVWDDCQWIDECSLEILYALCAVCARAPLLVVAAFRDGAEAAPDTGRFDVTVAVEPLGRGECEELASALLAGLPMPPALVKDVIDAAQGNPFFLEEVLGSLTEVAGMVDSGWGMRNLAVPTTLHGAIMSRVDGLDPLAKQTLQAAAVVGRVFSRDLLALVCGDDFDTSLEELRRRDFVSARGIDDYAFRQAMTAEVAYGSLLKSQRAELHRRTGEAMERLFPGRRVELSPVLAHHFEAAGVGERAFEYLILAARRAALVSANREALRRYRRALAIYDARGPGVLEVLPPVVRDIADVHEESGDVCVVLSRYADAQTCYATAASLTADARRLVTIRRKTAQMLQRWRKHGDARSAFEALLVDAGKSLDRAEAGHIYSGLGMARYHDGDLDGAVELVGRALEVMTALGDRRGVAQARSNLGVIHARRGDTAGALDCHRRAMSGWEALGDEYGLAIAHNNLGLALRDGGEPGEAARAFQRAVELFEKVGNRHGLACAYDNLGQVYMDGDDTDAAHECLKKAVAIMAEISMDRDEMRPEMWHSDAM